MILFIGFTFLFSTAIQAQGCSDAGVCTVHSFKPNGLDSISELTNQFKVGISYGAADNNISVFGSYLEYGRQFSDKFGIDARLTSLAQSGNDISTFGLSDIFLNSNYRISKKATLTLGFKIPLSDANKMEDRRALPMDYQSSLGTFDLLLGFGYFINKLHLVAAYQQPLTQNNNSFFAEDYPLGSPLRNFQSTNQYKRSGDILLRASYPIDLGQKFRLTPSLLPIYHLANDKYTDKDGTELEIDGSQGLTLNGNLYLDYYLDEKQALQFNVGSPFIVREVRPDGLTRSFVASLEYRIRF
ncbi:hypothetical protein LCM02_04875 [Lutimonas saemankumensis]|uniref:hypothetical protein n=1 Tax=Lutimonas saemankumensis TaxID=483016 RepID=UPI001CD431C3|nr:hypothetical protein [Lutimonas saemankumensis]MCA0931775.1 hypothetical protein [Lutimonas saemankumensis]